MKKPDIAATPAVTRGKYVNLLKQGTNLVILDPELMPFFPDSASVNRALHAFLAINDQVKAAENSARAKRRPARPATPEFDPRVGVQSRRVSR